MTSLTELAHSECGAAAGDIVIDATAGNGYDTLFLAQRVGPHGQVYAFDIQPVALERTAVRLDAAGVTNVRLIQGNHADMVSLVAEEHYGRIATIMFNLGYLPRGDKSIITKTLSTRAALDAALRLLRIGGTLTVLAYPRHPGGLQEMIVVQRVLAAFSPTVFTGKDGAANGPKLLVVRKPASFHLPKPDETSTPMDG